MAGLATAAVAAPMPAVLRNSRRFMAFSQSIPARSERAPRAGCYHDWASAGIANVAPLPGQRYFSLPSPAHTGAIRFEPKRRIMIPEGADSVAAGARYISML